ncbi:MAG: HEAT repeat domain-containing protein [Anaeromyxobacter sp.]
MLRAVSVLALAAVVATSGGCDRKPAPIHVASVRVEPDSGMAGLREAGLEPAAVEAAARAALGRAGFPLGEGERTYRGRVRLLSLRVLPPAPGSRQPRAEVVAELELAPTVQAPESLTYAEPGTGAAPLGGDEVAAWAVALDGALAEAARNVARANAQGRKPGGSPLAELDSSDPDVRERAVRKLGEEGNAAAVPALIRRLEDPDPRVVQRAVGALAQLRDPRAVKPLAELAAGQDPAFVARLARIVGDIGGYDARAFLFTLRTGHPDPRVQGAAAEAMRELDAREGDAARVADGK